MSRLSAVEAMQYRRVMRSSLVFHGSFDGLRGQGPAMGFVFDHRWSWTQEERETGVEDLAIFAFDLRRQFLHDSRSHARRGRRPDYVGGVGVGCVVVRGLRLGLGLRVGVRC